MFSIENFLTISNLGPLQKMSRMTKHVSKAGKVDPGDRVTLPVKFACKPELTLTPPGGGATAIYGLYRYVLL